MATKIQINSLPALIHLLESDDECAVEIRKSVLIEYERTHVLPNIEARLQRMVDAAVEEACCTKSQSFPYKLTLKPEIMGDLMVQVKQRFAIERGRLVNEIAQKVINTLNLKAEVEHAVTLETIKQVKRGIEEKLLGIKAV